MFTRRASCSGINERSFQSRIANFHNMKTIRTHDVVLDNHVPV